MGIEQGDSGSPVFDADSSQLCGMFLETYFGDSIGFAESMANIWQSMQEQMFISDKKLQLDDIDEQDIHERESLNLLSVVGDKATRGSPANPTTQDTYQGASLLPSDRLHPERLSITPEPALPFAEQHALDDLKPRQKLRQPSGYGRSRGSGMRLLHVETFALVPLEDISVNGVPPSYAILSHTWGDDEVTFKDTVNLEKAKQKAGFKKIRFLCEQACEDGLQYAWIDTCCIDKNSSHELSEAINSMYRWYMNATTCYVYLSDVPGLCPPLSDEHSFHPSSLRWVEAFEESRWFTRGWTLQELIAPRLVIFYGHSWNYIGSLPELIERVSSITNIQIDVLDGSRPLKDLSVARRLSWAARRETTRMEDQAYSLLGILDVNMPLLYGEGQKAFLRLQEEIIRHSTDQSIFAWDSPSGFIEPRELLLAPSPRCFLNGSRIRRRRGTASESAFRINNKGLEITLSVVEQRLQEDPSRPYVTLGILDCKYEGSPNLLALVMKQHPLNIHSGTQAIETYVCGYERSTEANVTQYGRILSINPRDLGKSTPKLLTITNDLQSQTYMQTFNTNNMNWFPIRFTGDAQTQVQGVEHVYPEECWYESSQTMRLRAPECSYGGVSVRLKSNRHILVAFGVQTASSTGTNTCRKIYAISYIDPYCPIAPHLEWLTGRSSKTGVDAAGLRLNDQQRLVAELWNGALTVSIENYGATKSFHAPSIYSLSPPTSPIVTKRQPSFAFSSRKDSMVSDDRSERSDESKDDSPFKNHRTRQCENCRYVKARYEDDQRRQEDERQRKFEEQEAARRRAENQKKMKQGAKKVGVGLTLGSMLVDAAEFL